MIDATYFDGQSSRPQPVTLIIQKRIVALRGADLRRSIRLSQLDISERLQYAPRILRFPDGAFLEISDPALNKLLRANRYRDPWVVGWQQNWLLSLFALISLLALLISGYQWGLPWAADKLAQHLPQSIERKIGEQELKIMDEHYLAPSKLDLADQARLQGLFAALKQPHGDRIAYRLEFRDGKIGPNAFALPNGTIVMTDQLVRLAGNDQAVLGVLGHELGHVRRRHSLRGLLQTVGVGVVLSMMVGDVSSALAAMPTFLLNQKYSRDFEREADQYAIDMMHANQLPLAPMAALFEKMQHARTDAGDEADANKEPESQTDGTAADRGNTRDGNKDSTAAGGDDDEDEEEEEASKPGQGKPEREAMPEYFSSHPSDAERIAKLRAADGL